MDAAERQRLAEFLTPDELAFWGVRPYATSGPPPPPNKDTLSQDWVAWDPNIQNGH
jgi:hypothetical protein